CSGGERRRLLRGPAVPSPRVVPRPHPGRDRAFRGRSRAGRRCPTAQSLAPRERTVSAVAQLDARRLARELAAVVEGEVRFSPGSRALYTTGGSNYRQMPIGVVIPRTIEDVVAAVEVCRAHDVPVLSRGGGTSLAGQATNVAVVLDFSKYLHRILEIDAERRVARVQPGVILDHLRNKGEDEYR